MKKLSILFLGLLLVAGFAFGNDEFEAVPTTDVDITASVTWGIDLNTNQTGFVNAGSFDLELWWIDVDDEVDFVRDAMDGLNGYIKLDNAGLKIDGGVIALAGTVSAKVVIDPIEVLIYGVPSLNLSRAPGIEAVADTPDIGTTITGANTVGGIAIKVPVDPITVTLEVASDGDWTTNVNNEYVLGGEVKVEVDPITVNLGATYGWLGAPETGISALVELALADVASGLDVYLGFDGNMPDGGDFGYDAAAGLVLALSEDNDDDESGDIFLDIYFAPYAAPATDIDLDVQFGLSEPEAGGLKDMLYANATVLLADLLGPADLGWFVDVTGGYDTGDVDPYFGFGFGSDEVINLNVGVALKAGLTGIDNTTITLDYVADDLTDVDPAEANNIGIFTIKTAVSF